jgi:microcystin-dependent protein
VESSPSTEESRSALSGSGELARSVLFNNVLDTFKSITTNAITCKSTSRPSNPVVGQMIYQTDTNSILFWTGTSWSAPDATPIGTISAFGGVNLPAGYLWCDGTQQLIASYPKLWSTLGLNRYGVDTATQFYLPNLTSHLPRGAATTGGVVTTNNNNSHGHLTNASSANFTGSASNTLNESADHSHNFSALNTISLGGHNHSPQNASSNASSAVNNVAAGNTSSRNNPGHVHPVNITVGATDSGHAHTVNGSTTGGVNVNHTHNYTPSGNVTVTQGTIINNTTYVPAFVEVNYIIKT